MTLQVLNGIAYEKVLRVQNFVHDASACKKSSKSKPRSVYVTSLQNIKLLLYVDYCNNQIT